MRVSIVVPVLDEAGVIASVLESLSQHAAEVIVVDGGSRDRTAELARAAGARVIDTPRGRARQMNAGAAASTGDVILFLHADTQLPSSAVEDIRAAMNDPACVGGRFDLALDEDRAVFKMIGFLISLRSRLSKVATGDQGMFVRRTAFEALGGFKDIPILEDVELSIRLKAAGKIACLRSRVVTSARRWQKAGVGRTILKMWLLKLLFLLGVSPFKLKRFYAEVR